MKYLTYKTITVLNLGAATENKKNGANMRIFSKTDGPCHY